jgi:hypothetical protein
MAMLIVREKKDIRIMVCVAATGEDFARYKHVQFIGNYDANHFIISNKNGELLIDIEE